MSGFNNFDNVVGINTKTALRVHKKPRKVGKSIGLEIGVSLGVVHKFSSSFIAVFAAILETSSPTPPLRPHKKYLTYVPLERVIPVCHFLISKETLTITLLANMKAYSRTTNYDSLSLTCLNKYSNHLFQQFQLL